MKICALFAVFVSVSFLGSSAYGQAWTHSLSSAGTPAVDNSINYSISMPASTSFKVTLQEETLINGQVAQVTFMIVETGTSDSNGSFNGSYDLDEVEPDPLTAWNPGPNYRYRSELIQPPSTIKDTKRIVL